MFSTTDMSFSWQVGKVLGPPRDVIRFFFCTCSEGYRSLPRTLVRLVRLGRSRGRVGGDGEFSLLHLILVQNEFSADLSF